MLRETIAFLIVVALLASPAIPCVGPCANPACPQTHVHVCDNGDGTRNILIHHDSGMESEVDVPNGSTTPVAAFGVTFYPKSGQTWGSVDECSDIMGLCKQIP